LNAECFLLDKVEDIYELHVQENLKGLGNSFYWISSLASIQEAAA